MKALDRTPCGNVFQIGYAEQPNALVWFTTARVSADQRQRTLHVRYIIFTSAALVELEEVLEKTIPGSPYCLIGHSDGASIALIHAAERPSGLKGIIVEAPHVIVEPKTLEGILDAVQSYDLQRQKAIAHYHGEQNKSLFRAWHTIWLSDTFRHWNIEYLLSSIICPCLIIHGRDDPYGTVSHVQLIASQSAGSTQLKIIEDCGVDAEALRQLGSGLFVLQSGQRHLSLEFGTVLFSFFAHCQILSFSD